MGTVHELILSNAISKDEHYQAAVGCTGTAIGVSSGFRHFKVDFYLPTVLSVDFFFFFIKR